MPIHLSRLVSPGTPRRRAALGLVLLALVAATYAVRLPTADGSQAALCQRHEVDAGERARIVTGSGVDVTVIGDSWSVGLGLADKRASWPTLLPARVRVAGFSGSGFSRDASGCGDRSFATRADLARGADLVVVEGGLNDYDQPVREIREGYAELMRSLRGRHVVLIGPAAAPARAAFVARVNDELSALAAADRVPYVDASGWPLDYLPDGLHLTPAGHAAFGRQVAGQLVDRGLL